MVMLAHAGHVAISALYVLPIAIVVCAIIISAARQRRRPPDGGDSPEPTSPSPTNTA